MPPVYPNNACLHICSDMVGGVQTNRTCSRAAEQPSPGLLRGSAVKTSPVEEHEPIDLPAAFWRLNMGWVALFWKINVGLIDENKQMWQLR